MKVKYLIALLSLIGAPAAMADVSLTGLAGLNWHNPDTGGGDVKPKGKFSYGALVDFGTPHGFSIETGALRVNKEYTTGPFTVDYGAWEIPLLLRFNVTDIFSAGAGGYYQIHNSDDVANTNDNDYGAKGAVRVGFPIAPLLNFVLEGQYNWGLKDMAPGPGTFKNRELLTLAGLQVGF